MQHFHGALLINKSPNITSFGVVASLQRQLQEKLQIKRSLLPKLGHGGTLDPFATGLLIVCVGRGVKLSRYFLGSDKTYEGVIRFGETTLPGDPTDPISETSDQIPKSILEIQAAAQEMTQQPYLQIPPMHSAKKVDGKPLYQLARQGIEIERTPKFCHLKSFEILDYSNKKAPFRVHCTSGTYVRVLAQDLAKKLGTLGMLDSLHRTRAGVYSVKDAMTLEEMSLATQENTPWNELPCWIPFDRLLAAYPQIHATTEEALSLLQGRQNVLFNLLKRVEMPYQQAPDNNHLELLCIYKNQCLIAIARFENQSWGIERVFGDNIQT